MIVLGSVNGCCSDEGCNAPANPAHPEQPATQVHTEKTGGGAVLVIDTITQPDGAKTTATTSTTANGGKVTIVTSTDPSGVVETFTVDKTTTSNGGISTIAYLPTPHGAETTIADLHTVSANGGNETIVLSTTAGGSALTFTDKTTPNGGVVTTFKTPAPTSDTSVQYMYYTAEFEVTPGGHEVNVPVSPSFANPNGKTFNSMSSTQKDIMEPSPASTILSAFTVESSPTTSRISTTGVLDSYIPSSSGTHGTSYHQ